MFLYKYAYTQIFESVLPEQILDAVLLLSFQMNPDSGTEGNEHIKMIRCVLLFYYIIWNFR